MAAACKCIVFCSFCSVGRTLTISYSILLQLNLDDFLGYSDKWGPSARICVQLTRKLWEEVQLQTDAEVAAEEFVKSPNAIEMETKSRVASHSLFTTLPTDNRASYILRVETPYLRRLVAKKMAQLDANEQVSFYVRASKHIWFRGTLGYIFEKFVYAWLYSDPAEGELRCTAADPPNEDPEENKDPEELVLKSPGRAVLESISGATSLKDANKLAKANDQKPFGWIPTSQSFPSIDAIVCTEDRIFTIQATIASTHSTNVAGFELVKQNLPVRFRRQREWCHLFNTDRADTADALRLTRSADLEERNIRICSAVLDIGQLNFTREALELAEKLEL